MSLKNVFLGLGLVALGACTSREHCNEIDAGLIGAQDARSYDTAQTNLKRGAVCTKEYSVTSFRKDYEAGYFKALKEACSVDGAQDLALLDVARNNVDKGNFEKLNACAKSGFALKPLQAAYDKTYIKGMCTNEKVTVVANAQAAKLAEQDPSYLDKVCSTAGNRGELTKSFKLAYANGLKAACDFGAVKLLAQNDARSKASSDQSIANLAKCPGDAWNIKQLYSSTYDNEVLKIKVEDEQRRREEAEQKASIRSSVVMNCEIIDGSTVEVTVNNLNPKPVEFKNGEWEVRLFDKKGKMVAVGRNKKKMELEAGETDTFKHDFYGREISASKQCTARYLD